MEPSPELQAVLVEIYRGHSVLADLCERLVDLDEGVMEWRYRHVKMVQRTIGTRRGTGGSAGAEYLMTTINQPLFPGLVGDQNRAVGMPEVSPLPDLNLESLYDSPNALAPHYSRFGVAERLLLTGHSHQAWPDVGLDAHTAAWLDAARYVDDKWDRAFEKAEEIRGGFARLLGDAGGGIALAPNTHELVVRLLSALPLRSRPRLVTTDGEFHTIRRQLDRAGRRGHGRRPGSREAARLSRRTARRGRGRPHGAGARLRRLLRHRPHRPGPGQSGRELPAPRRRLCSSMPTTRSTSCRSTSPTRAWAMPSWSVAGTSTASSGKGTASCGFPPSTELRPVVTGWYSEFTALAERQRPGQVAYGAGRRPVRGRDLRSDESLQGLGGVPLLRGSGAHARAASGSQPAPDRRARGGFDALDLDPAVVRRDRDAPLTEIGGFLALAPRWRPLSRRLRRRGVLTDARGDVLRFGPAPYLSDRQLQDAVALLGEVVREST